MEETKVYTRQEASKASGYTMASIAHWIKTGRLEGMYHQVTQGPRHVITYISQEGVDKLTKTKKMNGLKRGKGAYIRKKNDEKFLAIARKNAIKALSK